ncbi:MAG: tRNA (adenosine(37)-N6)-threonylcarbamoyltransferase complex dimerization subunit type 1 TsaB [Bacteroidetes bacterium]|nr:tRNA (adenosine(37)-N6)-threonylcarbamoyltransferase complex dimerization subunit type 1 TsaB [Bacteroidota bacterium]
MKILGIETATTVCGAALSVNGTVSGEAEIHEKNAHAERIMDLIDAVVKQSGMHLSGLDAIAVSIGPGSFTGLRIGLSIAKGLCFSLDKPLVAVSTLHALAYRAVAVNSGRTPYILAAIDARRDEVYCQLFRVNGTTVHPEWKERDSTLDALFKGVMNESVTLTGDAAVKFAAHPDGAAVMHVSAEDAHCSAATIALLGEQLAREGTFADIKTLEPKYVKEFYTNVAN